MGGGQTCVEQAVIQTELLEGDPLRKNELGKCRSCQDAVESVIQMFTLLMVCFVYVTQSRILWGMSLRERLSTSGWPVDVFLRNCLYSTLIHVISPIVDGTIAWV